MYSSNPVSGIQYAASFSVIPNGIIKIIKIRVLYLYCGRIKKTVMKNLSLILNVALLIAVGVLYYLHFSGKKTAVAQTKIITPGSSIQPSSRALIAYVDLDSLNANIAVIKTKRKELEGQQRAIETEWENGMRGLQAKKNDFIKKYNNSITQEQAQQFEGELYQGQQKVEERKQAATQELTEKSYKFLEDMQKKLKEFLAAYNKDKNYTYIFTVSSGQDYMAYRDSALNITSDVIVGMNQKLNTGSKP
jgi:outer membrane protein